MFKNYFAFALAALALIVGGKANGQARGVPDYIKAEVKAFNILPSGEYTETMAWDAANPKTMHAIGRVVDDELARGGRAWEANIGKDSPQLHMLYGPYATLTPGDYVAFIRMKVEDDCGAEVLATIDAVTSFAQASLRSIDVMGSDLVPGKWVQVPLAFHYAGGNLECRVMWTGYADLRVDRVVIFRLDGTKLDLKPDVAKPAVETGFPEKLVPITEKKPFPDIFPVSKPPSASMVVFDLAKLSPDWQTALVTLQGIVNRTQPRIYVLFNPTDAEWLNWMRKRGWITKTQVLTDPNAMIDRFADSIKGMIVTDPKQPATKNVATMIASLKDGIVVSPRIAKTLKLKVLDDLRDRWSMSHEAYKWAFDNLWPKLNHHVIACSYPDHIGLRDYLVQNKIFIFWISGPIDGAKIYADPQAEIELMEKLLAKMPVNIPVMSYPWAAKDVGIGEGPGVTLFAEFGKYLVGSINTTNLTVHSGIRVPPLKQKAPPPLPKYQKDKVYVSWIMSDGDNLPVLQTNNFPQLWQDKLRGTFPIGWSLSPSACMLMPDIVEYYYSTSTPNDYWLAAVSGVGYTYPDFYGKRYRDPYRTQVFDGFLDQTAKYMRRSDENIIWPMNVSLPELFARYAERIPFLKAIFPDYGKRVSGYEDSVYPTTRNVPVFHAMLNWNENATSEEQINSLVAQIRGETPRDKPAFMHLFILNWFSTVPMLNEVLKRLGPDYVCVRPDHLTALYKRYLATEKVLTRVPSTVVCIENQPLVFTASVQNVLPVPVNLSVGIPSGLSNPSAQPSSATLSPGQTLDVTLTGIPSGGDIVLETKGGGAVKQTIVGARLIPNTELASALPSGAKLRFVRNFEAEDMVHRSGKLLEDRAAANGKAWAAIAGETKADWIMYGPYMPFKAGKYIAVFRVKRLGPGSGTVVTLDASANQGQTTTGAQEMFAQEMPEGEYRSVPVVFTHPGGPMELRANWFGNISVALDSVALWAVESK